MRENRQDRRQTRTYSNRDAAIGVTVAERGGMGVRVTRVLPDGPAAQAGVQAGDTIIEVDGNRVDSPQTLTTTIQESDPGETVELAVLRNGREETLDVRLTTRQDAIPAQYRQQPGQYGQSQSWQQGRYEQDQSNRGQYQGQPGRRQFNDGQYDQQGEYGRQQGQYRQQQGQRWSNDASSVGQATYTETQESRRLAQRRQNAGNRQLGEGQLLERVIERLDSLEARFDQLSTQIDGSQPSAGAAYDPDSDEHDDDDEHEDDEHDDSDDDEKVEN